MCPSITVFVPRLGQGKHIQGAPGAGTSCLSVGGGNEGEEGGQGDWDRTLSRRKGVMML